MPRTCAYLIERLVSGALRCWVLERKGSLKSYGLGAAHAQLGACVGLLEKSAFEYKALHQ